MVVYTREQGWEILSAFDLQKMPILEKKDKIDRQDTDRQIDKYI